MNKHILTIKKFKNVNTYLPNIKIILHLRNGFSNGNI